MHSYLFPRIVYFKFLKDVSYGRPIGTEYLKMDFGVFRSVISPVCLKVIKTGPRQPPRADKTFLLINNRKSMSEGSFSFI